MDRYERCADLIKIINKSRLDKTVIPELIKEVCSYYNEIKSLDCSDADLHFLRHIALSVGIPQYYSMLKGFLPNFDNLEKDVDLDRLSMMIQESSMHTTGNVILHKYQWNVLNGFDTNRRNRFFLSATTSFGKTFLVYEIIRKMEYKNIALIFPTISLLSENLFKIHTDPNYSWIKEGYNIHTLSDVEELGDQNVFIYTPERYLSFLDKNKDVNFDFVFVDEVYKLDNGFIIDEIAQENERDVAYRVALYELLKKTNTDALLVGPYIVLPSDSDNETPSSFKLFLDHYGFTTINYNTYDIVSKVDVSVGAAKQIAVGDEFDLKFTETTKTHHVIQLVRQLLERKENTIIYCGQKYQTEDWAKELMKGVNSLPTVTDERLLRLVSHLENLFANRKGVQWIVTKALKRGIGIHHGLVPKYIQQEIISLFNVKVLKVLICTTTITEGVNTTAKNMIVLSSKKGRKDLKKFDAQNIEGRAGRFMQHYQGRVFILDKKFTETINSEDEFLKHKLFEKQEDKKDVDLLMVEPQYLTDVQKERKKQLDDLKEKKVMPQECFDEFRTISYDDKLFLYNSIKRLSTSDLEKIKDLIGKFVGVHGVYKPGLEVICQCIRPIIKNEKLRFYVENGNAQRNNCYLVDMVSAFVARGFAGSANYYIDKEQDVDKGVRKAAEFVFNTLRYQVVKYLGLFNMLYKNCMAAQFNKMVDNVSGIEALLLRLEYNADTMLGRRASDVGASFKVIKYYDTIESSQGQTNKISQAYNQLDEFEKSNVVRINKILS